MLDANNSHGLQLYTDRPISLSSLVPVEPSLDRLRKVGER
jgi:hypothetical protein